MEAEKSTYFMARLPTHMEDWQTENEENLSHLFILVYMYSTVCCTVPWAVSMSTI